MRAYLSEYLRGRGRVSECVPCGVRAATRHGERELADRDGWMDGCVGSCKVK